MTTNRTVVYAASDDLLEIEGMIREEFYVSNDGETFVGFSNGVVLELDYKRGSWRLRPLVGVDSVEIVHARGEDAGRDDDGCPGYSDKAIINGEVSWAVAGINFALA